LRTRDRIKPVYVSVGHLCDLPGAIRVVLDNAPKYRLPIPARLAHQYVNDLRRRVRSRQCQGFPGNPGGFHPQSGVSRSLNRSTTIEKEASFV
jgi:hypothetical protein